MRFLYNFIKLKVFLIEIRNAEFVFFEKELKKEVLLIFSDIDDEMRVISQS
jgi:hypothetical protein